ncbi:Wzz/FepE/Etk N-terminal domain-containing protein [Brumicola blandensis]|uniref:Wzz/FepE/Etk N-terminal domain-containing protein n=1 Tax=Brumicola blandensis TaxID=3075611 RepID=A0AAW8R091_9ALTE|nr:Wzz/FepE/Etk N-terminal domain-containing protein [Alteromonas sp. W409]MDT0582687.1 Wzz/FepE/Etk N-terminal domain-containing protein [Alteromonas sp. W409]
MLSNSSTNMTYESNKPIYSDSFNIQFLLRSYWANRFLVLICLACGTGLGILYALGLHNVYESKAVLIPVQSDSDSQLNRLNSQFGGIASLAGINLSGGSSVDKVSVALETIKSRKFLGEFIKEKDILVHVMAVKGWDVTNNVPIYDDEVYDKASDSWIRHYKFPKSQTPTYQEAAERFSKMFIFSHDSESGIINASLQFYSPKIAQQWLVQIIEELNTTIKNIEKSESNDSITYLKNQVEKTNITENKALLYEMIQEQTKKLMFAEIRDEYILQTIDPPSMPEVKVGPKRPFIVILSLLIGLLVSTIIIILKALISPIYKKKLLKN